MVTKLDKEYFAFATSPLYPDLSSFALFVHGIIIAFASYFAEKQFVGSLSFAVALAWFLFCMVIIDS